MAEEKNKLICLSENDVLWYAHSFELDKFTAMKHISYVSTDPYFLNYLIIMRQARQKIHAHVEAFITFFTHTPYSRFYKGPRKEPNFDYDKFVMLHKYEDYKNVSIMEFINPRDFSPEQKEEQKNNKDFQYFSIKRVVEDYYIKGILPGGGSHDNPHDSQNDIDLLMKNIPDFDPLEHLN
jgi:hypothetical protein